MSTPLPLSGIKILEHGERLAVTACGSVLASLGAEVSAIAWTNAMTPAYPRTHRDGKRLIAAAEHAQIAAALAAADVIIASTDKTPLASRQRPATQILADITAYGASGPLAGRGHADALVQAMSGLADTTGEPDSLPTLCGFPQTEGIAALYAVAGILVALQVRAQRGHGQDLDIAMFDCAFSTLSTFLPFHFIDKPVTRSGNRHVLASPWNAYRAGDGWLLICTGSDEQWKRLCEVIARPELTQDPRLAKAQDRVQHREIVDGAVRTWIAGLRAADAAEALEARGIAAGPVVPADGLAEEPNLAHRGMYAPAGMRSAIRYFAQRPALDSSLTPGPSPGGRGALGVSAGADRFLAGNDTPLPLGEGSGVRAAEHSLNRGSPWPQDAPADLPLAGLRVLEIGQYTTAPLVARNLGALGAQVLKIEPPGGDATRAWPPQQDGQGYFFALSNSDKLSTCLDLREETDRARFRALLQRADVLVENLKPGSLDKLGFGPTQRAALNPRLVYCAISGFGADSAYPGRPAFDTVIQAMSGIMDLIRVGEVPQKTGISYADVLGGLFALIGTLAALVARERSGKGEAIDIAMQDAAAWITQWTKAQAAARCRVLACSDGYVVAEIAQDGSIDLADAISTTRSALVERLRARGIEAAPVLSVTEVARSPQAQARGLLCKVQDSAGRRWQIFANPIRLAVTPACTRRAIGPLGEANAILSFVSGK